MITIKVRRDAHRKLKGMYLGGICLKYEDCFEEIRSSPNEDFEFIDITNGEDVTYSRLMCILKSQEHLPSHTNNPTSLLTRIIKGGGFIEYIKTLENKDTK